MQVFIIIIFFIYIDLMRKRCQLMNVDVDVEICCLYIVKINFYCCVKFFSVLLAEPLFLCVFT